MENKDLKMISIRGLDKELLRKWSVGGQNKCNKELRPSATWLTLLHCRLGRRSDSVWLAGGWSLGDGWGRRAGGAARRVGPPNFCHLGGSGDGEVRHPHGDWGHVLVREVVGWGDFSMYQHWMFWWKKMMSTLEKRVFFRLQMIRNPNAPVTRNPCLQFMTHTLSERLIARWPKLK